MVTKKNTLRYPNTVTCKHEPILCDTNQKEKRNLKPCTLLKKEILQVSNIYKKEAGSKIMPVMAKDSYVHMHCHLMVTCLNNEGTPTIQ